MSKACRILAVETSGRQGSIAVASGREVLGVRAFRTDHNHAVELMPTIAELCRGACWAATEIDEVHLSIGPGSFTGLRIAVAVARTLAATTACRIVAVPSLEVIAQNALQLDDPPQSLGVVLDAKRGQVYAAAFRLTGPCYEPMGEPRVGDPVEFLNGLATPRTLMGQGVSYHAQVLATVQHEVLDEALWQPTAETVWFLGIRRAATGRYTPSKQLTPIYLRLPEAEEVWQRRQGVRPVETGTDVREARRPGR